MKLPLVDSLLVVGFLALVVFTGYHLFSDKVFAASDFAEGLMLMIFGKTAHLGANAADKYFNAPEDSNVK